MCGVGITLNVDEAGCFFVKGLAVGGAAAKQVTALARAITPHLRHRRCPCTEHCRV